MKINKIALLGNMNNNLFVMGRYLRDKGVDCELLIFKNNISHFNPSSDTYNNDYLAWVNEVQWGGVEEFLKIDEKHLSKVLKKFDILIGCGLSPAYVKKAGRKLDIFVPYGSDIYEESKFRITKSISKTIKMNIAAFAQRKSFQNINVIHLVETNELYEKRVEKYFKNTKRWNYGIPMVYHPQYENIEPIKYLDEEKYYEVLKAKKENNFILMYHGRHVWGKDKSNPNDKGVDALIIGWSNFIKKGNKINSKLILFEYGEDVQKTKSLINDLKINETIIWLKKDHRKNVIPVLMLCDLSAAEFTHSWICSGIMYEALAAGVPIMAYRDETSYQFSDLNNMYQIINCRSAIEIENKLDWAFSNKQSLKEMGENGKVWYKKYVVEPVLGKYLDYINNN